MRLAACEKPHLIILLAGFHLAVDISYIIAWEVLTDYLITFLKGTQVEFFVFLDERIYDVALSAFFKFLANEVIYCHVIVFIAKYCSHRFAARRQFVDNAHVEVAIDRHSKGARDGCSCHHQHMGWGSILAPQFGTLRHAEAVLLVDDR